MTSSGSHPTQNKGNCSKIIGSIFHLYQRKTVASSSSHGLLRCSIKKFQPKMKEQEQIQIKLLALAR